MRAQRVFDRLSERAEWFLSTWWGALAYIVACASAYLIWGWDGVDRAVYVSGGLILVLLIGSGRRDSKAVHAKLDDIDERDDMTRVEELSEQEIEERRK